MGPEASTLPPPVTLPGLTLSLASGILIARRGFVPFAERFGGSGHFFPEPMRKIGEVSMRKILTCAALAGAILVSACNTIEGVGRDVASAGDTVAGAADDNK